MMIFVGLCLWDFEQATKWELFKGLQKSFKRGFWVTCASMENPCN